MPMEPERLATGPAGEVWVAHTTRPFAFASPFGGAEHAILLWAASDDVGAEEQAALSAAIVAQGCRHVHCIGHDVDGWTDAIDRAFIATDPDGWPPDERFVMTSPRREEALEHHAWCLLWISDYEGFEPRHFLGLLVGGDAGDRRALEEALRWAIAQPSPD